MSAIPVPVQSSNIASIGYDPDQQLLVINFHNGGSYIYKDVPPDVHQGFYSAESIGSYFHRRIKGVYEYERLPDGTALPELPEAMTFKQIQEEAYRNAAAHGFYKDAPAADDPIWLSNRLMLMVSELAEALEEIRGSMPVSISYYLTETGARECLPHDAPATTKPEGFASELADAIIRIADCAESLGLDLGAVVRQKMLYNRTRPHRHGGKSL